MTILVIQIVKLIFYDVHSHQEVHSSLDQFSFTIFKEVSKSE
jgi:hypothetical protein